MSDETLSAPMRQACYGPIGRMKAGAPGAFSPETVLAAMVDVLRLAQAGHEGAGRALEQLGEASGFSRVPGEWAQMVDEARKLAAQPAPPSATGEERLKVWSARELVEDLRPFQWCVESVLTDDTYGQIAGLKKTLKTHVASAVGVAIASGQPLFGHFKVPKARPALFFVGEGGRRPYTRRMQRIARSLGVRFEDLPIFTAPTPANVSSDRFRGTLADQLALREPGFVLVDPWYAYHGPDSSGSNLFEEGGLLTLLSAPCVEAGAVLLVNNHFNKTGTGRGLDRITQAGGQEWSDSWLLLSHRVEPDVSAGHFQLVLEIGSRQWGGSTWDLEVNVGCFDAEAGEFQGELSWSIAPHAETEGRGSAAETETDRDVILDILADMPWTRTKTEVRRDSGGRRGFDRAWDGLRAEVKIVAERLPHAEGGRSVNRDLWAPAGTLRPGHPTGSAERDPVAKG